VEALRVREVTMPMEMRIRFAVSVAMILLAGWLSLR
jgi:hypothetical protein